jgi:hypothetical protein
LFNAFSVEDYIRFDPGVSPLAIVVGALRAKILFIEDIFHTTTLVLRIFVDSNQGCYPWLLLFKPFGLGSISSMEVYIIHPLQSSVVCHPSSVGQ